MLNFDARSRVGAQGDRDGPKAAHVTRTEMGEGWGGVVAWAGGVGGVGRGARLEQPCIAGRGWRCTAAVGRNAPPARLGRQPPTVDSEKE